MTTQNLFLNIASDPSGALGLSSSIGVVMADYVEGALGSSSRARSYDVECALVKLFHESLKRCPDDVVLAIQGDEEASEEARAAYLMGHISFAQSLVSQNLSHKVCDEFKAAVLSNINISYVRALFVEDLTNTKLMKFVDKTEESISRRLKKLREWGITDCRKQGTSVINFLTPAARNIFEEFGEVAATETEVAFSISRTADKISPVALRLIERKAEKLPNHMKEFSALGAKRVA